MCLICLISVQQLTMTIAGAGVDNKLTAFGTAEIRMVSMRRITVLKDAASP